jgi:UDPglucose 6-dehydrogenase
VIIMTDPLAFKTIDVTLFKTTLKSAVVFDARNMYDPAAMARAGVEYFSIGRNHAMMHKEHADETYS